MFCIVRVVRVNILYCESATCNVLYGDSGNCNVLYGDSGTCKYFELWRWYVRKILKSSGLKQHMYKP
jgi:hypothetical protein